MNIIIDLNGVKDEKENIAMATHEDTEVLNPDMLSQLHPQDLSEVVLDPLHRHQQAQDTPKIKAQPHILE